MVASIFKLKPAASDNEPADPLDVERARLDGELRRLAAVDERLAEAERRLAEVSDGLAALSRAEREQVVGWATGGAGAGDAPVPLLSERKALLARRLDAEAEVDSAQVAVGAVAERRTALIGALNAIATKFREQKLARALVEARGIHAEAVAAIGEVAAKLMKIEGLRLALIDAQAAAVNARNGLLAAHVQDAVAEVEKLRPPEVLADRPTVDQHAAEWREALR